MVVTKLTYVPLTEQQLQLCTKRGLIYYCENAHLLRDRNVLSCVSAIYYDTTPAVKIKHCKSKYIKSNNLEPKILDGVENLILSNLPKPWTLVCGTQNRPFPLKYSTFRIINRTELCESSLTAGAFYIMQTVESCNSGNILSDRTFTSYYAFNKITFDTLVEQYKIYPSENIQNLMSTLLEAIPVYNWNTINWFNSTKHSNILEETDIVHEAQLDDILHLIVDETQEEIYKDTADFEMAKDNFKTFFNKVQTWEKLSVISAWLGLFDLIILVILLFYTKI